MNPRLRSLVISAARLAAIYAAFVAIMFFAQRSLLFPGASGGEIASPAPVGQWVEIATADGERLTALYTPPQSGKSVALVFHGNGDTIANFGFLAKNFADRGYGFLGPAFRGYPGSTGSPTEQGLLEDGRAAYAWLKAQEPAAPIVIIGYSLGSGIAVNTAAELGSAALVLVSSYDSIATLAAERYFFLPVRLLIRDPLHSDERIARAKMPKLFIHGDKDTIIPIEHGRALFALAPEPKTFNVQQGRGHNDVWTPQAVQLILDFVKSTSGQ